MTGVDDVLDVEVWLPPFLQGPEEELANHKTQAAKALKYVQDQYDILISYSENYLALGTSYRSRPTEYAHYEIQQKRLQRECDADENKVFKVDQGLKSLEAELKSLKSQNEQMHDEILQLSENIDRLAVQREQLTSQTKDARESMELLWRTYVTAKNTYKKNLHCHIRLHEPAESLEETSSPDPPESLTFSYLMDDKTLLEVQLSRAMDTWKMLGIHPFLPASVEAQKNLHETNDIRDFIFCLYREAVKLSKK